MHTSCVPVYIYTITFCSCSGLLMWRSTAADPWKTNLIVRHIRFTHCDYRIIWDPFWKCERFTNFKTKWIFRKIEQPTFSIWNNLQMTSIDAFQETSGWCDWPHGCLRRNEWQNNLQNFIFWSPGNGLRAACEPSTWSLKERLVEWFEECWTR